MRVFGYWLFYAVVGLLLLAMMVGGGGDLGSEDKDAPTKSGTKVLSVLSGLTCAIAGLGAYLLSRPDTLPTAPTLMVVGAGPLGLGLTLWSWVAIARDLRAYDARHPKPFL